MFVVTSPLACRQHIAKGQLHNARDYISFKHITHAIYVAFPPRTYASCLLKVPGEFPVMSIFCSCFDITKGSSSQYPII